MTWRKSVSIGVIVGLLLALIGGIGHAGPVWNVDSWWPFHLTINGAVSFAQPEDQLVILGWWDSYENVEIWKPLYIIGDPGPPHETVHGTWSFWWWKTTGDTFFVGPNADGTEIRGLRIIEGLDGIELERADGCTLADNILEDNLNGIRLDGADDNEITKNEIHDNEDRGIVLILSDKNPIKLNEVYNNRKGIVLKESDENDIVRNEVHNNTKLGILLVDSHWNVIKLNEVYENPLGIVLEDSKKNEIRKNDIHNNEYGVYQEGSSKRNAVHWNSIVGNTTAGIWNDNAGASYIIDAVLNWWGSVDGPTHPSNPRGDGDTVSDNVIFSPWLGIGTDDEPGKVGWQPVSPMLIIVDDVGPPPGPGAGGYLGTAIDAANSTTLPGTDTIEVRHGTYADDVAVTDSATIISETGSASNTHLTGNMALGAAGILLGRIGNGFSIHGNIDVGAGVDASTIHINWNNLYGIMTNDGLNTLDATYNYWGAGSGRVGDIDYRPFLPETVGTIIGYMDDYGLDPLDAVEFADLVLDGFSANEAIVVMALGNTFGLTTREAAELIAEYGWIAVQNALLMANGDYETFVTRLIGYGFAGTNSDILGNESGGGGASGEGGTEGTYSQGETIHLSFILTSPITGEVTIDPTANLTIVRVDQEPVTVVYWSMISYDPETGQYSLDIDTSGFAPGIYDLHIGTSSDGHNHQVRIEIT